MSGVPPRASVDQYRQALLERRDALRALIESAASGTATVELDQTRVGRVSRMDALQGQAMSRASEQRRRQELVRIGSALRRIEDGEFGACTACGEVIAEGRLRHDPATPLCIRCASAAEAAD